MNINLQIIQDNTDKSSVKVTDFKEKSSVLLSNVIRDVSQKIPELNVELESVNEDANIDVLVKNPNIKESNVFVVHDALGNVQVIILKYKRLKFKENILLTDPVYHDYLPTD